MIVIVSDNQGRPRVPEITLLDALADAFEAAAATLRRQAAAGRRDSDDHHADTIMDRVRSIYPDLGFRQAQMVELLADAGASADGTGGMTASELGRAISYSPVNAHISLAPLVDAGIVEKITVSQPYLYRLALADGGAAALDG